MKVKLEFIPLETFTHPFRTEGEVFFCVDSKKKKYQSNRTTRVETADGYLMKYEFLDEAVVDLCEKGEDGRYPPVSHGGYFYQFTSSSSIRKYKDRNEYFQRSYAKFVQKIRDAFEGKEIRGPIHFMELLGSFNAKYDPDVDEPDENDLGLFIDHHFSSKGYLSLNMSYHYYPETRTIQEICHITDVVPPDHKPADEMDGYFSLSEEDLEKFRKKVREDPKTKLKGKTREDGVLTFSCYPGITFAPRDGVEASGINWTDAEFMLREDLSRVLTMSEMEKISVVGEPQIQRPNGCICLYSKNKEWLERAMEGGKGEIIDGSIDLPEEGKDEGAAHKLLRVRFAIDCLKWEGLASIWVVREGDVPTIPGGKRMLAEETLECAGREFGEETGIDILSNPRAVLRKMKKLNEHMSMYFFEVV